MNTATTVNTTWLIARASGWVAYVLLTAAVSMGLALSKRWFSQRFNRIAVADAHTWITLLFYVFIVVHVVTDLLDPFTKFNLFDVLVPFHSAYRTLWLTLGIVGAEVAFALGITVLIRQWIGFKVWHGLHMASYVLFFMSLLHGLGTGSDTTTTWGTAIYAASAVLVIGLTLWRLSELRIWRRRALWIALASLGGIVFWAVRGPYAPQWAEAAGTPKSLLAAAALQRGGTDPQATPTPIRLPTALQDTVTGQVQVGDGEESRLFLLKGSGTGTTPVDVAIQVVQSRNGVGGQIELRTTGANTPLCAGPLVTTTDTAIIFNCAGYGQQVQLNVTFSQLNQAGFAGTLSAQSGAGNAGTLTPAINAPTNATGGAGGGRREGPGNRR